MLLGSAVSFFLGDRCGVEGDCAKMDACFFFTAFGTMRTLDGIGSAFHFLSWVMAHALAREDLVRKKMQPALFDLVSTTILENNEKKFKIIDLATIANDYNKSNLVEIF